MHGISPYHVLHPSAAGNVSPDLYTRPFTVQNEMAALSRKRKNKMHECIHIYNMHACNYSYMYKHACI